MELPPALIEAIIKHLPKDAGLILMLSAASTAEELTRAAAPLVVIDDVTKSPRLSKLSHNFSILRAVPSDLPAADRSVGCILAVNTLSRYASPEKVLAAWSRCLRDQGRIVLVERLLQSQTLRTLHRFIEPSRHWLAPEHLTCLLLNAGYLNIRQAWPPARSVITTGSLRVF
jgi:hypothetical protein